MSSSALLRLGAILAMLSPGANLFAAVKLPRVIDNNMVLQRGMPVPIWGTADPGEQVTVTFRNQKKTGTADAQGKWMVKLDSLEVGEPGEMVIAGSNTLTLKNVVVGEVWLGSGQSNIDSGCPEYEKYDPVLKAAVWKPYQNLRVLKMRNGDWKWQSWEPKRTRGFSAQLFYFGLRLQQELNVPVGLIEAAWAGSPSGPFISAEAFKSDPDIQKAATAANAKDPFEKRLKSWEAAYAKWEAAQAGKQGAAMPQTGSVESDEEEAGLEQPGAGKAGKKPIKPVPYGQQKTGGRYELLVRPIIPFAIRGVLWDQGEGGSVGGFDQPILMTALIRSWRKDWGQGDFPWIYVKKPSGGGCAYDPNNPVNAGALPFVVQPAKPPDSSYRGKLHHEGYSVIRRSPNTFLVNTSDLATGVHPHNKSGYGTRDSLVALGAVYGKPVEYYGPVYESHQIEGDKIRVFYTHLAKGLRVPEGQKLQGFLIAGEDKQFVWADAVIDGDTVVLSSPKVPNPTVARYAWTWPLAWANLFNSEGLPAMTFQTR